MINKRIKTVLACALSCTILVSNAMGVDARPSFSKKPAQSFSNAWERSVTIYIKNTNAVAGVMVYGYDKTYIHEDYVWTQSVMYRAQPIIKRNGETYKGAWKKGSLALGYSKLEIHHNKYEPKYVIKLDTKEDKKSFKKSKAVKSNIKNPNYN